MAVVREKLSARSVETISKPGRHSDGDGLYLVVDQPGRDDAPGARRWLFMFRWDGKLKEMGLGGYPTVSLAKARRLAQEARTLRSDGVNPIEARRAKEAADKPTLTFGEFADALVDDLAPQWRNAKHVAQWRMTLTVYAAPIRPLPIDRIGTEQVLEVLKPIWTTKAETASRVRGRMETVFDAAKAKGLRTGENPARWRGHLDHLLPKRRKLSRGHHAALPYGQVAAFMADLRQRDGAGALALEFAILTAARTTETIKARWVEIDRAAKVWTIPAERMKAGRVHRVPLSDAAMAVLDRCLAQSEFIFPGTRRRRADRGKSAPLSTGAMERVLDRMKVAVTVHGFRSTFRDWAGEATSFPKELAELSLAHVVGDDTERAYSRGDALARRRKLMEAWASYCDRKPSAAINVTPMIRSA